MDADLPKTYDPATIEPAAWQAWIDHKDFHADPSAPGDPYCIVIPPPNVTGALHLGHAINNTLQDILTRVHRMRGFNTVWIPGLDHAGIATQAVVEKQLKEKENKTRHDVGREALVQRIWDWKQQFGDRIVNQLQRLGCSCDWDRTRFTLDDMCAKAVRETFFKLFKDGLIYRGKRLVNWDVHLQTSISDDEIYHETVKTNLWHIRYEIVGRGSEVGGGKENQSNLQPTTHNPRPTFIVVATTRPETLLGDTAVAVHSEDPRWNWAIGKFVELPLTGRKIPIIADDILVDPKFGTGVVKVTPAHDPNDYAVYQRHLNQPDAIDIINILNPDGTLNDAAGIYKGMKRDAARKKIVEDLTTSGALIKEEPYETQVGHSDRSKTPVEPYLSDQWFVKMAPLAEPALEVVRNGTIKFFPERHAQQYLSWLGEKRDWPISRQLWWGHRIPVWRLPEENFPMKIGIRENVDSVANRFLGGIKFEGFQDAQFSVAPGNSNDRAYYYCVAPGQEQFQKFLESLGAVQDPDVLDTWFSSALWPHSTLGWPEQTADLAKWYPTSVLLTGRDIITLWVARMVMMGMYNMGSPASLSPVPRGEGQGEGPVLESGSTKSPSPQPSPLNTGARGIPFSHVAINPTILDGRGERMSKSKGNGVDPLDIIETHGADALRFTLATMATETQDVRMPVKKLPSGKNTSDKFDLGRNFCNKLWNAARFVFASLAPVPRGEGRGEGPVLESSLEKNPSPQPSPLSTGARELSLPDRWIISKFHQTLKEANDSLAIYRFDQYAKLCYDFFWRDFCDWYVEAAKPALKDSTRAEQTAQILLAILDASLRLLHPVIPFITETIWWRLNEIAPSRGIKNLIDLAPSDRLINAAWPSVGAIDASAEKTFARLQEIITAIRNVRNEHKVDQKKTIDIATADADVLANRELVELLATCKLNDQLESENLIRLIAAETEILIAGLVDPNAELARLTKRRDELTKQISALEGRLNNAGYLAKAPPKLVKETQDQLEQSRNELQQTVDQLSKPPSAG